MDAQRRVEAYLAQVDAALPARVTGAYLVGSAALGDWEARVSNVDVVVTAAEPWTDADVAVATGAHGRLAVGDQPGRVAYTTLEQLAGPPQGAARCFEGRAELAAGEFDTPLTWVVLAEEAVAVRGPEWFATGADGDGLAAWAAERLATRWAGWARRHRRAGRAWRRQPLAEDLLEVARLHVAATRGVAVSKVRAGAVVREDVSERFERVVDDAVGFRRGGRTSRYWGPSERKAHSLELVELLVSGAAERR